MALLQASNAIFHHPLDDATESLKAQAWNGTGESFGAGKVAGALVAGSVAAADGGAYATAAGSGKLAFTAWVRSPSAPLTGPPPQAFRETERGMLTAMGLPSSRLGGWT